MTNDNRIHVKIKKIRGEGCLVMSSNGGRLIFTEEMPLFSLYFAKRRCRQRGYVVDEVY